MKYTNVQNLPEPIVQAIVNDPYSNSGADISATGLINPPRQRVLKMRYQDRLTEDIADRVWALVGNNVHNILERANVKDALQEQRLHIQIRGWKLSGACDLFEPPILSDYKVTSVWAVLHGLKPEWIQQLNIYAHLYRDAGFDVEQLQIIAILRDWSKHRAKVGDYPQKQVVVIPVPLWDFKETQTYLENRIGLHQKAEHLPDDELPLCTAEERWEEQTKYAVVKGKNKKATRVFDTMEAAETCHADCEERTKKEHRIDVRKGGSKRCPDYCNVNLFCNQYQAELFYGGE